MAYQTMGRFAIGSRAFGFSSGLDMKVGKDDPGPQRMRAWRPVEGMEMAWGMAPTRQERGDGRSLVPATCPRWYGKRTERRDSVGACQSKTELYAKRRGRARLMDVVGSGRRWRGSGGRVIPFRIFVQGCGVEAWLLGLASVAAAAVCGRVWPCMWPWRLCGRCHLGRGSSHSGDERSVSRAAGRPPPPIICLFGPFSASRQC